MRVGRRKVATLFVAIGLAATFVLASGSPAVAKIRRPQTKHEWPARVEPVARAVERIRGQKFKKVVRVHFLGDRAFEDAFGPVGDLPGFLRKQLRREEALERPLGLLGPDEDLVDAVSSDGGGGVAGFFDGYEVFIRGKAHDVFHDYLLAHELTHVLQSQRRGDDFNVPDDEVGDLIAESIFEGEAEWVASRYVDQQSPARQRAFERQLAADYRAVDEVVDFDSIPDILSVLQYAPYVHGRQLMEAIAAGEGRARLDDFVRHPPSDDLGLVNLLREPQTARPSVPAPAVAADEERTAKSTRLGALRLYLMLATQLDPLTALDVADDWHGDRAVTFERDGTKCARVSFRGRDSASTDALAFALAAWAQEAGNATVERAETVVLTACGRPAAVDEDAILTADAIVAARNELVMLGLRKHGGGEAITCVARTYAGDPRLGPAFARDAPDGRVSRELQELFDELRAAAAQRCSFDPGPLELP